MTVNIREDDGNLVPYADNLAQFRVSDNITIAGVDNGDQTSHAPFQADYRRAYNGDVVILKAKRRPALLP